MASVFYSVGQNVSDHKSGSSPTVSITGGVATFSEAQTATNLGVGDRVTYDGSSVCYLKSKITTSQWNVCTATGGTPGNTGGDVTLNSIAHEYSSLSAAEGGASDGDHLGTTNLTSGPYMLYFPCYYDTGADTTATIIDGWTDSSTAYITVYTPTDTATECNQSQRHDGKWKTTAYHMIGSAEMLRLADNFTRAIGILVEGGTASTGAITCKYQAATNAPYVTECIVRGDAAAKYGILCTSANTVARIKNCIVYDIPANSSRGFWASNSSTTIYIYNCLSYNVVYCFESEGTNATIKNCIAQTGRTSCYVGTWNSNSANCISEDTTVPDGSGHQTEISLTFADESGKDFHLAASDTAAIDDGVVLSSDSDFPFSDDIDGDDRGSSDWDIGPDEYIAGGVIREFAAAMSADASFAAPAEATRPVLSAAEVLAMLEALLGRIRPVGANVQLSAELTAELERLRALVVSTSVVVTMAELLDALRTYQITASIDASFVSVLVRLRVLGVPLEALAELSVALTISGQVLLAADLVVDAALVAALNATRPMVTNLVAEGSLSVDAEVLRQVFAALVVDGALGGDIGVSRPLLSESTSTAEFSIDIEASRRLLGSFLSAADFSTDLTTTAAMKLLEVIMSIEGAFVAALVRAVPSLAALATLVNFETTLSFVGEVPTYRGRVILNFGPTRFRRRDRRREHAFLRGYRQ